MHGLNNNMTFVLSLQIGQKAVFRQLGRQLIVTRRKLLLTVTWPMVSRDAVFNGFLNFTNNPTKEWNGRFTH